MHFVGLLAGLAAATVGLTEPELEVALRGEVPTRTESFTTDAGKASGRGVGAIVVEAAIDQVWKILSRYDDKAEYIPRLKKVEVLASATDLLRVRMTIDASVATARYTAFFRLDPVKHTIHWTLDRSAADNTINDVDGEYRLFEMEGGKTLVVYRTWVDTGFSVPQFIQNHMAKKSIPDLLRAVRARVVTGGVWRKP